MSEHDLLEEWFHAALSNREIALRDRVRMACGFKAVMGLLDLVGDVFAEVPSDVLAELLREAARDLMAPRGPKATRLEVVLHRKRCRLCDSGAGSRPLRAFSGDDFGRFSFIHD